MLKILEWKVWENERRTWSIAKRNKYVEDKERKTCEDFARNSYGDSIIQKCYTGTGKMCNCHVEREEFVDKDKWRDTFLLVVLDIERRLDYG